MESKAVIASLKEKVGKLLADNRMLRAELKKLVAERDRTALQKRNAEEKILALEKLAVHGVELFFLSLRGAHGQVVQKGRVRAPWEEILVRNMQRHFTVLAGLIAAPVLGNGHTPGAHHVLLL